MDNPEQRLWLSVIKISVEDISWGNYEDFCEAEEWFFGKDSSFETVCSLIDMNPEKIRKHVDKERNKRLFTKDEMEPKKVVHIRPNGVIKADAQCIPYMEQQKIREDAQARLVEWRAA